MNRTFHCRRISRILIIAILFLHAQSINGYTQDEVGDSYPAVEVPGVSITAHAFSPQGTIIVHGRAETNQQIALYMKTLESHRDVDEVELQEVKLVIDKAKKLQQFTIVISPHNRILKRGDEHLFLRPPSISVLVKATFLANFSSRQIKDAIEQSFQTKSQIIVNNDSSDWQFRVLVEPLSIADSEPKYQVLVLALHNPFNEEFPIYAGSVEGIVNSSPEIAVWASKQIYDSFLLPLSSRIE